MPGAVTPPINVAPFTRPSVRAWRIVEISPGCWQGHLHVSGRGVVDRTISGPFWKVEAAVRDHRQGLPVHVQQSRSGDGPTAA